MSRWLVVRMKDSLGLGKFGLYHDLKQSHAKLSREGNGREITSFSSEEQLFIIQNTLAMSAMHRCGDYVKGIIPRKGQDFRTHLATNLVTYCFAYLRFLSDRCIVTALGETVSALSLCLN